MEISPYLSAIQSLNGQTPGEKYKSFHSIANQIIQNKDEKKAFLESGSTSRIQPALLPYLRILIGNKLKLKDSVIEALKSDDVVIVEQALRAKWFFNANNEYIQLDYILEKVIPFVSVRTRRRLVNVLGRCLVNDSQKAEAFFTRFLDLYGLEQALPILVYCSEQFIYDTVLRHRIILSNKILSAMYLRYPTLVLRYLQLGNKKNDKNLEDRKLHCIDITKYLKLLPAIVKKHPQDFFEIYEYLEPSYYVTTNVIIGAARAKFVLSNYANLIIQKAACVINTMHLKLVSSKLNSQQFEAFFSNLFPKDKRDFFFYKMLDYLKYYPKEKQFPLLREKFKLAYGTDILDEPSLYKCPIFFKFLPLSIKENYGRKVFELHQGTSDDYCETLLPPKELMPIMMERIDKGGYKEKLIITCFDNILLSCAYYQSEDEIIEILRYCYNRSKSVVDDVYFHMVERSIRYFKIQELHKSCWQFLMYYIQDAYIEGDLFEMDKYFIKLLFYGDLLFFIKECQEDPMFEEAKPSFDKFMEIFLTFYLEHDIKIKFLPLQCPLDFKRDCLERYLTIIPLLYPENHKVWGKFGNIFELVLYLVQSIDDYNFKDLCRCSVKKYKLGKTIGGKSLLMIRDYAWLVKLILVILNQADIYKDRDNKKKLDNLIKILKRHDLRLYQSFAKENTDFIKKLASCDIVRLLKCDKEEVLSKWLLYLNACREKLQRKDKSARKIIKAVKWHQDLPIKFVEQCLLEIEKDGSILVLALLLEGETFDKITQPLVSDDKKAILKKRNNKKEYQFMSRLIIGMNYLNPPMSFESISVYCQGDNIHLTCSTLYNVAYRVPVNRVMAFANQLLNKSIPIRKLGIRLVCQVSSYLELEQFVIHVLAVEKEASIRKILMKMIWNMFKLAPSVNTWQLMKICIDELSCDDHQPIYDLLNKTDSVDRNFVSQYLQELLKKIFQTETVSEFNSTDALSKLIKSTTVNFISEDILVDIIEKKLFKFDVQLILKSYLFADQSKFDKRLDFLMNKLQEKFKDYNKPDPERYIHYPSNYQLHKFFMSTAPHILFNNKTDMSEKFVTASLDLISEHLKLHEEPFVFMTLYLVKDFVTSSNSKEFGVKCGYTVKRLVEILGSEIFLYDISHFLERVLIDKYSVDKDILAKEKIELIEGLSQIDERRAALIGNNLNK